MGIGAGPTNASASGSIIWQTKHNIEKCIHCGQLILRRIAVTVKQRTSFTLHYADISAFKVKLNLKLLHFELR